MMAVMQINKDKFSRQKKKPNTIQKHFEIVKNQFAKNVCVFTPNAIFS